MYQIKLIKKMYLFLNGVIFKAQLSELKAGQAPGASALRSALLDPAVNLLLQRLRQELASTRTRLEETQNELSAWKFTPDRLIEIFIV